MKVGIVRKTISIKRRIDPDNYLKHFIRHNSSKRRYVWNKFVEEYKKCNEDGSKFNPNKIRMELINDDIQSVMDAPEDSPIREMYCSDIVLGVFKQVCASLKQMKTMAIKYGKSSELQFKSHDPFRRSFKVRAQNTIGPKSNKPRGKVHFRSDTEMEFRASYDYIKNKFSVTLMEPICDKLDENCLEFITYDKHCDRKRYSFRHEDIKNIVFMEDLGKYYIVISCNVDYYIYEDEYKRKKELAGIDLGIHNPVTLYYEDFDTPHILNFRLDDNAMARMQYYDRCTRRIQRVMDIKFNINKAKHEVNPDWPIYSNRYLKMRKRYRHYWRKICNIRRNWRFEKCNKITKVFSRIVVDEFSPPDNSELKASNKVKRFYNHYNRQHAMSHFMECLHHTSVKHGCQYINSPDFTTRTCSNCGFVNSKLPLNKRRLKCEQCGLVIDRDVNAAINCYQFLR